MAQVAIFIGSASDEPVIAPCAEVLRKLGVSYRFTVTSAHRTPERPKPWFGNWRPKAAGCSSARRAWPRTWPGPWPPAP